MGFSRQGYCSGLPFPSPGDPPDPGIEPVSPALVGRFFTTEPPGKPLKDAQGCSKMLKDTQSLDPLSIFLHLLWAWETSAWIASARLTQAAGQVLRKAGAARGRESGGVAPAPPGHRWVLSPRLHPCPQVLSPSGVAGCTHLCVCGCRTVPALVVSITLSPSGQNVPSVFTDRCSVWPPWLRKAPPLVERPLSSPWNSSFFLNNGLSLSSHALSANGRFWPLHSALPVSQVHSTSSKQSGKGVQ